MSAGRRRRADRRRGLTVLVSLALALVVSVSAVPGGVDRLSQTQAADQVGEWGPVLDWGISGKHMALLPTGGVLVWRGGLTGDNARVWDPASGSFAQVPATFGVILCSAQATLADGRVVVIGGQNGSGKGIKVTSLFDPFANTWTKGADMAFPRWYGTATTLPDGRVLATSGNDASGNRISLPEVYDPVADKWTTLTGANRAQDLYPFVYVLPNGTLYEAGTGADTWYLNTGGTGSWTAGPVNAFGTTTYSESGAMYAPGKIIRSGGGNPAVSRTAIIDMNAASPTWKQTAGMAFPRRRHNMVVLADGSMIAVGGTRQADDVAAAVLEGEIWDPATDAWTTTAAMTEARMYHSTALLLPDGRVVSAGGEASGALHAQIYSPPYLFKGARPTIDSAPGDRGLREQLLDRDSRRGRHRGGGGHSSRRRHARDRHEPALRPALLHPQRREPHGRGPGNARVGTARLLPRGDRERRRRAVGGALDPARPRHESAAGDDHRHGDRRRNGRSGRRRHRLVQRRLGDDRRRRHVRPRGRSRRPACGDGRSDRLRHGVPVPDPDPGRHLHARLRARRPGIGDGHRHECLDRRPDRGRDGGVHGWDGDDRCQRRLPAREHAARHVRRRRLGERLRDQDTAVVVTAGAPAISDFALQPVALSALKDMTFEGGRLVDASTGADTAKGAITVETAATINGIYSAAVAGGNAYLEERFAGTSDLYVSLYVRIRSLPSSSVRLLQIWNGSAIVGRLALTPAGKLRLHMRSSRVGSDSAPLVVGHVYRVALHQRAGTGGDARLEGFLADGAALFGAPFAATGTGTWTTAADRLRLGATTSAAVQAVVDDVRLAADAMPAP